VTPDVIAGMAVTTSSVVDLATRLAKPFGISVSTAAGDVPTFLPSGQPLQFNAILTETPFEIIERVARYAGVLVYDDAGGNLVIANVGAGSMASGLAQGVNVQRAQVSFTMDERYSEYWPMLTGISSFEDGIGNMQFAKVFDNGVPRFRPLIIVSEQFIVLGLPFAEKRAQWEMSRRWGRSQSVRARIDSWRDSDGKLWQPNYFAPISLPKLKLTPSEPWIIGEVSFERGQDDGTTAELVMMPKEAFQPQPEILVPFLWDPNGPPAAGVGAGLG
jgi:prophage tail gpP-like protein